MIPHFQLYGEGDSALDPGFVHLESIAARALDNGWEIRPHGHDTLDQLLVVRAGRMVARIEGREQALAGPAAIHVPAGTVHGFRFAEGIDGDVLTFSAELRGTLLAGMPDAGLVEAPFAAALGPETLARLEPLLASLRLECSGHDRGRIAAAGWLVGLLLLHVGRMRGDMAEGGGEEARAAAFRRLVDRHFREHRPLAFYAAAMGVTERTLTRLARARFGCSPASYVHRRVLLEARRQLAYGTRPIARIAEELGFADPSYFSRFYRRMAGEPPTLARGR